MTLRRTRVTSIPDMVRMSAAFSRPGIDPRIWCSLAYAKDESKIDKDYGDLLDVVLLPSEQEVTVRVPQAYAGKSFGSNDGRIHKDDEVVVLFPAGDPAEGGVVVARLWGPVDLPPELAAQNEKDIVRVLEKDIAFRFKLEGEDGFIKGTTESSLDLELKTDKSTISVKSEADAKLESTQKYTMKGETVTLETTKVRLGSEGAGQNLINGSYFRSQHQTKHQNEQTAYSSNITPGLALINAAGAQFAAAGAMMVIPIAGAIMAGPIIAAAGAQLTAGAAQMTAGVASLLSASISFETQSSVPPKYLSDVSKTDP